MLNHIQQLLNDYNSWLREKISLRELKDWVEITTPYLDRHNDRLQIYAKPDGSSVLLSDDSWTIRDLESTGCNLSTPKRQELLKVTLNGFGVRLNGSAIEVTSSQENFPLKKHSLVQAMLAVNDLFYLAEPVVKSLFLEDVMAWLDDCDIRYTPKTKLTGRSGFDHVFDFVIPKSRRRPERVLRAMAHPNRNTAESFMHAWDDTREVREKTSTAYAILNDGEDPIPSFVTEGLRSYQIQPVPWSTREEVRQELAA